MTAEPTGSPSGRPAAGPPDPDPRPAPLVLAGYSLLVGGLLTAAALQGRWSLLAVVVAVQLCLAVALLTVLDTPAITGSVLVAAGSAAVASGAAVGSDGDVGGLAGAVGLGLGGALVHQLRRSVRTRVAGSLADTLAVTVLVSCAACLLALAVQPGGRDALVACLAAGSLALVAGRVGDRWAPLPRVVRDASRGWLGVTVGLAAAVAGALGTVASLDGADGAGLSAQPVRRTVILGVAAAMAVMVADIAVDLGAAGTAAAGTAVPSGADRAIRRRPLASACAAVTVPFAVLGPVALLAGRLVQP